MSWLAKHTHTKINCSGTVCEKRSSSCHWDQSGSDSVKNSGWAQSHKQYDKRVIILFSFFFSHGPVLDYKASVAPDLTYSSSLSCKSLLASRCAVLQTTVSSDDCAINTSMNGCYPYVASIYVRLSNVTIHPYLHCGGNRFLLLFIAVIKHHPSSISSSHWFLLVSVFVCVSPKYIRLSFFFF